MHATSKRGAVTENTISLFTDWILLFHQWHVMSFIYWFLLCLCIERDDFTSNAGTMWIARDVNIFFFYTCDSSKRYYVMNRCLSRRLRRAEVECKIHSIFPLWLYTEVFIETSLKIDTGKLKLREQSVCFMQSQSCGWLWVEQCNVFISLSALTSVHFRAEQFFD